MIEYYRVNDKGHHGNTPDVDSHKVVEVKHIVSTDFHANISDHNILVIGERFRKW